MLLQNLSCKRGVSVLMTIGTIPTMALPPIASRMTSLTASTSWTGSTQLPFGLPQRNVPDHPVLVVGQKAALRVSLSLEWSPNLRSALPAQGLITGYRSCHPQVDRCLVSAVCASEGGTLRVTGTGREQQASAIGRSRYSETYKPS